MHFDEYCEADPVVYILTLSIPYRIEGQPVRRFAAEAEVQVCRQATQRAEEYPGRR